MNNAQRAIKIFAICLAAFILFNICSGVIFGISFFTDLVTNNETKKINFEETYLNVEEIFIETISSDIIIEPGNSFKVQANTLENSFSSKLINRKLTIKETITKFNNDGVIIVTIPSTLLKKLEIESGAGKINIEDLNVQFFEVNHGAGSLKIKNSTFNETEIDGGAGKIEIKNSTLNNLNLDAGVGQVEVSGVITGNSNIECGVGQMNINVFNEVDDYTLSVEKGIGSIKVNGNEVSSETIIGNGNNILKLEGGIGSISIDFEQ